MLWLGLALAAYDTPSVLTGGALRRAKRRCGRGDEDACAVVGFSFVIEGELVMGEVLVLNACREGSTVGCHIQSVGVLEGWWVGDDALAVDTLSAQCLNEDYVRSCRALLVYTPEPDTELLHACELGDAQSCGDVAVRHYRRTSELRADLLESSCAAGFQCDYLARGLMFGVGMEQDGERGLRLALAECSDGSGMACTDVAMFQRDVETLLSRCETGGDQACLYATRVLWDEGREAESRELGTMLCQAGHASECIFLANYEPDERRKIAYAALACDGGSTWGCWLYGAMLLHGRGTDPQPRAARPLLEQSCEDGVPGACNSLAVAYSFGCGVEADQDQAAELWTRACNLGFVGACGNLGEQLWYTEGPEVGEGMLQQSCAGGSAWACGTLGSLIEDRDEGLRLLEDACDHRPDGAFCVLYWQETLARDPELLAHLEQSCAQAEPTSTCNDSSLPWASMSHRACAVLGELYLEGLHVVRDEEYGAELITRACEEGGDYEGCRLMESLQE